MKTKIEHFVTLVSENDDQLAFSKLYQYYFPGLFSFASGFLKDNQHSEEVVLDVFLNLWQNRKTLPAVSNLSVYLYVSVKHGCISFLRKQKIIHYGEMGDQFIYTFDTPEENAISKENINAINEAIASLPSRCRLIFRLIKEERLKYHEVAELLDISVKTVETQMSIANKKLIKC